MGQLVIQIFQMYIFCDETPEMDHDGMDVNPGFEHGVDYQDELPSVFVRLAGECDWVESRIDEKSYLRCMVSQVYTPTDFGLILAENQGVLEGFMQRLQLWVKEQLLDNPELESKSRVRLEYLSAGLHVLCMHQGEWHRAFVMHRDVEHPKLITVHLIDHGYEVYTTISDLRYMLEDMLNALPAQGINCRLHFEYPYNFYLEKTEMEWSQEAMTDFYETVKGQVLGVTFVECTAEPMEQDDSTLWPTWLVKIAVLTDEEPSKALKAGDDDLNQKLEAAGPSVPKHADETWKVKEGFTDLATRLYKYIPRCTLPGGVSHEAATQAKVELDSE